MKRQKVYRGHGRAPLFGVLLALGLLLGACGAPVGPQPPTDAPVALVSPGVGSPLYEHLKDHLRTTQHDGSQSVADYDLLILDGDRHTPQALAEHELLSEALKTGTWVLLLDATYAHKKEGLFQYLKMATEGDTEAYLFRRVTGKAMPTFEVSELNLEPPLVSDDPAEEGAPESLTEADKTYRREAFAARLAKMLWSEASCDTPLAVPEGAIYAVWCYSGRVDWRQDETVHVTAGDTYKGDVVQPQIGYQEATFTFTLLLRNGTDPTGDLQILHVQADGKATPTTSIFPSDLSDKWRNTPYLMGLWRLIADKDKWEFAWVQTSLDIAMGPADATAWTGASGFGPQNPGSTDLDSYSPNNWALAFNYNPHAATAGGPSGGVTTSVGVTKKTSKPITDWTWQVTGVASADYHWRFYSNDPSVDKGHEWAWIDVHNYININYNDLNQGDMPFGASASWTTVALLTDTQQFNISATQGVSDIDCTLHKPFGKHYVRCEDKNNVHYTAPAQTSVEVDMRAVVPPRPVSLTLSNPRGPVSESNRTRPGEALTGTLTLSKAAPFAYGVGFDTSNAAVTVDGPVRVEKGDTSVSFGLTVVSAPQAETVVTISSFGKKVSATVWLIPHVAFRSATYQAGQSVSGVASADFNGDGYPDLAISYDSDDGLGSGGLMVRLNDGKGGFDTVASGAPVALTGGPADVLAVDLLASASYPDLALTLFNDNKLLTFINKDDLHGSFFPPQPMPTASGPSTLASADFDGNGFPDLVAANSSSVSVWLNVKNGFAPRADYAVGGTPIALVTKDFDGDGHIDIAVGSYSDHVVTLLHNQGDGTFASAGHFTVGDSTVLSLFALASADFNGDGHPDLVATMLRQSGGQDNVIVYLNDGAANFSEKTSYLPDLEPTGVSAADLNGDGYADMVVAGLTAGKVSVYLGLGGGTFAAAQIFAVGKGPEEIVIKDFNDDGRLDLVVANSFADSVSVLLNSP